MLNVIVESILYLINYFHSVFVVSQLYEIEIWPKKGFKK